jgi:hypothetical protein
MKNKKIQIKSVKRGSALIMTIVLTVLLAIIAVMFVAVARMDRASTSNIADNKSLDLAAKSITEIISKDLLRDTPGVAGRDSNDPNNYSDYPDPCNPWLASLEPNSNSTKTVYNWLQISDVNGYLRSNGFVRQNVPVKPSTSNVVKDNPAINLNTNGTLQDQLADADGDGIADSKWVEFANIQSSKGRKIYAAVRVIDNSGMVNVNTAYNFWPSSADANKINGSSQMQINLKGLLKPTAQMNAQIDDINKARCNNDSGYWPNYERNVIWDYNGVPDGNYIPYDISDELELRYRYCIDSKFVSRFEVNAPETSESPGWPNYGKLYDNTGIWKLANWQTRITEFNDLTDRRHILTAYNLDRIIEPNGAKMINLNTADVNDINSAIRKGLYNAGMIHSDANKIAAQIAVNVIDYRDTDSNVTVFKVDGVDYYGFESPCVYISELAYQSDGAAAFSYAIELYKPYSGDADPVGWQLAVGGIPPITINWPAGQQFHVIVSPLAPFAITGVPQIEPSLSFIDGDTISLRRTAGGTPIIVDSVAVPLTFVQPSVAIINSTKRDITPAKCIRRLWGPMSPFTSLGDNVAHPFINGDLTYIQDHPKNGPFTNIGEIGMIFRKPAYLKPGDPCSNVIGYGTNNTEAQVRLDLTDLTYQKLFKYLTVMDPNKFHLGNPNYINETRVKGRININTAPASVIAQLPWVSLRSNPPDYNNANLAKAIVAYRDKQNLSATGGGDYRNRPDPCGFGNIGQLCNVNLGTDPNYRIDYYSRGIRIGNQTGFPDLTPDDAADDFEERDLIFARISDLVTVRSDIFTAYILVRIGTDGPQKRYMVILDRSGVKNPSDKVKIIAFQPVPQAR